MEQDGICASGYGGGTVINCGSMGTLSVINGTSSKTVGAIIKGGAYDTHKNCYYLSGIQGIFTLTTKDGDNVFYKEAQNEGDKTTREVVSLLNGYIETPEEGVSTSGWCKWVVGDKNLPILDFDTEWDGTNWKHWNGSAWVIEE